MLTLLIETSTERSILALAKIEQEITLIRNVELPVGLHSSQHLVPMMEQMFAEEKHTPKDVELIVSGVGPGSYTGIRVGVSVAKGLAYALNIPIVGVPSLIGFVPQNEGPFYSVIDAKMSGVYLMEGSLPGPTWKTEPAILSLEDLSHKLEPHTTLVTPKADKLQKSLFQELSQKSCQLLEVKPDPISLIKHGYQQFLQNQGCTSGDLQVIYLRKTQAEIEREAN